MRVSFIRTTGRDMAEFEDLVAVVYPRWLRRRSHEPDPYYVLNEPPRTHLSEPELERVYKRLDELSDEWSSLGVGQSVTVDWPRPERPA